MNIKSTLPNVIYAGIQRTGSTWLYDCFKEHPQVFVPYLKEIHYFDRNFDRGKKWYETFFKNSEDEKILIDITPNYFQDTSIPKKISDLLPSCKIIIVLRNPIDYIFSLYKKHRQSLFVKEDFNDLLNNRSYLDQGLFSEKMKAYFNTFKRNQIFVGYYKEFSLDNQSYLSEIYQFLQVEEYHPTITNKVINSPVEARYRSLHQILRKIQNSSRKNKTLHNITNHFRANILHSRWYSKSLNKTIPIRTEQRGFLESYYYNDVHNLSEILDKDMPRYWGFS